MNTKKSISTAIKKCHKSPLVYQQQRRIDFVTELPYDIIPLILEHFETIELINLFQISTEWKARLISCKNIWSNFIIHGENSDNIDSAEEGGELQAERDQISPFIAAVTDNVLQLQLINVRNKRNFIPMILKQIILGSFVRLQYLELCECTIQSEESEILHQALDTVSNTLLYLKLVAISPKPTTIYFEKVLATCNHLEGFWCDSSVILFPRRSQETEATTTSTTVTSKLKQLVLNIDPVHDSDIDRIAHICPNIRRLYINANSPTAADIILQHYEKELEYLNINMYICLITTPPSSKWSPFESKYKKEYHYNTQQRLYPNTKSTNRGLRYLALRRFDEGALISLLHRHAHTLEELYLYYNNNSFIINNDISSALQNTNNSMLFSNLRVLNISSSNDPTFILTTLLTHVCPTTLQSLQIGSCNLSNNPIVLASIKELQNLEYLHLNHSIYANRDDVVGLLRHFATKSRSHHPHYHRFYCEKEKHQIQQLQHQSLRSLLISGTYFQLINDMILQEIGKIETLEKITINDAIKVTEQGLHSFCQVLQRYNNGYLRSLELNHVPAATSKTLEHLLSIPTLKTLVLRDVVGDIKREDFVAFVERGIHVGIYYLEVRV